MKTWERARVARRCGLCGGTIAAGAPILARWMGGHGWRKIRCAACAGEPVPADLPPLGPVVRAVAMTPIEPPLAVASLARDWKLAASAEREPGCDDD
jgi:hypothetical protein